METKRITAENAEWHLNEYFKRLHPAAKAIVRGVIHQEHIETWMDPVTMDMVWQGWVAEEAMRRLFGDVYRPDSQPENFRPSESDLKEYKFRYGAWRVHCGCPSDLLKGTGPEGAESLLGMVMEEFEVALRYAPGDGGKWAEVKEAYLRLREEDGWVRVIIKVRGWRGTPKDINY